MESPTDWWNGFFTGLFADFWRAVIPAEHTVAEVDFLEKVPCARSGLRVCSTCPAGTAGTAWSSPAGVTA